MIRLPLMTPTVAGHFHQALQSYVFQSYTDEDELPPELRTPLPAQPSDLVPPRLVEVLLCKQDSLSENLNTLSFGPMFEMGRLLQELERIPDDQTHMNFFGKLLGSDPHPWKSVLRVFDGLVGQLVAGLRILYPTDWETRLGGMGVMSYLNTAGALELCGMLDAAEALRKDAPTLSRKEDRATGLIEAAHIWMIEGRMDLSTDYFLAAAGESHSPEAIAKMILTSRGGMEEVLREDFERLSKEAAYVVKAAAKRFIHFPWPKNQQGAVQSYLALIDRLEAFLQRIADPHYDASWEWEEFQKPDDRPQVEAGREVLMEYLGGLWASRERLRSFLSSAV
jgi:hypothetical protein